MKGRQIAQPQVQRLPLNMLAKPEILSWGATPP
jgi:hypothetical protein